MTDYTPVQRLWPDKDVWVKREDLYSINGVNGSKVRQAEALVTTHRLARLVGYGGRRSTTAAAFAAVGKKYGVQVEFHTAAGPATHEMAVAERLGAVLHRHCPGYLSVLAARARAHTARVPNSFIGLAHPTCVRATAAQWGNVVRLRNGVRRVVVACGAGVTLAGILSGMSVLGQSVPVLAVAVGAPPNTGLLETFAPQWKRLVCVVTPGTPYATPTPFTRAGGITFDELYEAKCLPYLQPGDVLWCSGIRPRPCTSTRPKK